MVHAEKRAQWSSEWWWKVLFLRIATPEWPYFIAFFPIEHHRWLLSYIGVNKAYPPTREEREAFLADIHVAVISVAEDGHGPLVVPIWYSYEAGGEVRIVPGRA